MKRGLEDFPIMDMPTFSRPAWVTDKWTAPKHRVRYRFWSVVANLSERAADRMERIFDAADARMSECGPRPIVDPNKLPTSVSFSWSEDAAPGDA